MGVLYVPQVVPPGHPGIGIGVAVVEIVAIVMLMPLAARRSVLMMMGMSLWILKGAIGRARGVNFRH
jgi:hypothetical protein